MRHFIQTSIRFCTRFGFGQGRVTTIQLDGENALALKHAPALYSAAHCASSAAARKARGVGGVVDVATVVVSRQLKRLDLLPRLSEVRWPDRDRMSQDMRPRAAFCLG